MKCFASSSEMMKYLKLSLHGDGEKQMEIMLKVSVAKFTKEKKRSGRKEKLEQNFINPGHFSLHRGAP